MTRGAMRGGTWALLPVWITLAAACRAPDTDHDTAPPTAPGYGHAGLIYGRVTTEGGASWEGPLRWGGDEEALWGNTFNGAKRENTWAALVPGELLPMGHDSLMVFGVRVARWERELDLDRPFMARYGDLSRIDKVGRDIRVTLKSGTVTVLNRFEADDLADGVLVMDGTGGFVALDEGQIRSIELLPTVRLGGGPSPLHGTVRAGGRDFTGLIQWNREQALESDVLAGLGLPFDTVRSIARDGGDTRVTLRDGGQVATSAASAPRGVYVDDRRYGRVLVSWNALERVVFTPGGPGPGYDDFPSGAPLTGGVLTRSGRRLSGRIVFDLDESEITETLDAPSRGVDYSIFFGLVAAITAPATVALHSGEELQLEPAGDLGDNAGILVFTDERADPEYVQWAEVERLDFDRPLTMYPPNPQP